MNGLKARLISLKNRVQDNLRRKRKNARRVSSTLRKLFTIRRLRLKIRNRRSQYSSGGSQGVELVSSATHTEEVDVPSEVVTPLPTNFASESASPVAFPSTLLPTFTPPSECLSVTQRSPSLNSWDSCSSIASTLSKEEHGISLQKSDNDDKQGVEYKDEEESTAIPSAGGNSVCGNDKMFPNTSSGIVADYTASEEDNNVDDDDSDFNSDSDFDSDSSTSGSISDGEIQSIACDDGMEQSADEDLEIQSLYRPVTQSSSSFGSKPELKLLTLPLAEDDPSTSDTHPPAPSPPTTTEAERKWREYIANRSTTPEYFLFPQFTLEQEEWIMRVNHPFKEYVLQTWQNKVHASMYCWLEDLVN